MKRNTWNVEQNETIKIQIYRYKINTLVFNRKQKKEEWTKKIKMKKNIKNNNNIKT